MLNPELLDAGDLNILYLAGEIDPFDPTTDPRGIARGGMYSRRTGIHAIT